MIAKHDLRATKTLGQNFLLDLNLTAKIARGAGDLAGKTVIEIGPGPGGLTRALLDTNAREVIALEFDPRAVAALADLREAYPGRLTILHQDALQADCASLGDAPRVIVANLPYNIATPLLIGWLKQIDAFDSLTLMFQREVAERIVAKPGGKTYGRLAVMVGWLAEAKILFDIPPSAFTPAPKVTSSMVHIVPHRLNLSLTEGEVANPRESGETRVRVIQENNQSPSPLPSPSMRGRENFSELNFSTMEKIVAAAFGQRRKMLRAALKTLNVDTEKLLQQADIDPQRRAETLYLQEFVRLAETYSIMSS